MNRRRVALAAAAPLLLMALTACGSDETGADRIASALEECGISGVNGAPQKANLAGDSDFSVDGDRTKTEAIECAVDEVGASDLLADSQEAGERKTGTFNDVFVQLKADPIYANLSALEEG